jgi:hypothetical protein
MSYYQSQGQTSHFIGQTNNPFKIIRITKHFDSADISFSKNLASQKSEFQKSETRLRDGLSVQSIGGVVGSSRFYLL